MPSEQSRGRGSRSRGENKGPDHSLPSGGQSGRLREREVMQNKKKTKDKCHVELGLERYQIDKIV